MSGFCEKKSEQYEEWDSNEEIKIFREYLRIPSVHPNIDYRPCVSFLKKQAENLELPVKVVEVNPDKPVVIITWEGTDPSLKSIILNSHMDVVPVFEEKWTQAPFGANMSRDGKIYARGAQDMKCVGTQFLGAIRALKLDGYQPKRTIHATFVPEEELGGVLGMRDFVKHEDFRKLNCGFAIDEGIAGETDEYPLFYGERSAWLIRFHIAGTPGHGSLLLKGTAGEKARYLIDKLMDFRANEVKKLENNPEFDLGDVTTVNITQFEGGVQGNVVPPELKVHFDIRLSLSVNHQVFETMIMDWCREAGGDITLEYDLKSPYVAPTKLDDSNPFWAPFKAALDKMGLMVKPKIFPAGTDSKYIRHLGIPAIGFSPINNTPVLLHDHDEYLRADTYLRGIQIYKEIIANVAKVD